LLLQAPPQPSGPPHGTLVQFGVQEPMQAPFEHMFPGGHACPQPPQFDGSFMVCTQPGPWGVGQSIVGGWQLLAVWHSPALHAPVLQSVFTTHALPPEQGRHWPPPQSTSVSVPSLMPSEQVGAAPPQMPLMQGWPAQACMHEPQLFGSLDGSTHDGPVAVWHIIFGAGQAQFCWQVPPQPSPPPQGALVQFGVQPPVHMPLVQNPPTGHACPHPPQFALSAMVFTQIEPVCVMHIVFGGGQLQFCWQVPPQPSGPPQGTLVQFGLHTQAPFTHAPWQVRPQPPQLAGSFWESTQ
jgi:hypothetical protein